MQKLKHTVRQGPALLRQYYQYLLFFALLTVPIFIVYGNDLAILFNEALQSEALSYVLLMPFLAGVLFYLKKDAVKATLSLERHREQRKIQYLDEVIELALKEHHYNGDCPNAELSSKRTLLIPINYRFKEQDIQHIIGTWRHHYTPCTRTGQRGIWGRIMQGTPPGKLRQATEEPARGRGVPLATFAPHSLPVRAGTCPEFAPGHRPRKA